MLDYKKLEAFLDSLEVETHFPSKVPAWPRRGVYAPVANPSLEQKMDKYDIFKQDDDYTNVSGHPEFPILARRDLQSILNTVLNNSFNNMYLSPGMSAYTWANYGGISRGGPATLNSLTSIKVESPIEKILKRVEKLNTVEPAKIPNPRPEVRKPQRSPDYVHTITAWRAWEFDDFSKNLESLGTSSLWEPKVANSAICKRHGHSAPHGDCACGFWSFKSREQLMRKLSEYADRVAVIGTVEIWGRVFEHKHGWRSEFAYPKELWLLQPGMESLSWTYGVPVRTL